MIPVPQEILESIALAFGTAADQLKQFGGGGEESDGIVYAYPHETGQRLLKIMAYLLESQRGSLLCLDERLRFMRYLGENGARIAFPQRSPQGNLYETVQSETHLWVGYCMDIAPGKSVREKTWDPAFFRNWGQAIGVNHKLAQGYPSWRSSVDPETGQEFLTWRGEWQSFYDWCQEEEIKGKWGEIKDQLEALPVARKVFGFIHNDPHIWNLRADGDQVTVLDFDVANHHWFINDIAIACQNILIFHSGGLNSPLRDRGKLLKFLEYFMEGYQRENDLPAEWLDRLDLFISYRRILLFIVMYGWARSQQKLYENWKGLILSPPELVGTAFTSKNF